MGYLRHQAMIVTGFKDDITLQHTDLLAVVSTKWPDFERLISPIIPGMANAQCSFMIAVDGSKEGWLTSDEGEAVREAAKQLFRSYGDSVDWVEVCVGGDDGAAEIDDTNLSTRDI